jgi:hypothetical protein
MGVLAKGFPRSGRIPMAGLSRRGALRRASGDPDGTSNWHTERDRHVIDVSNYYQKASPD